jgi:hypothetical protein
MRYVLVFAVFLVFGVQIGCGASEKHAANIDVRPMEENKAFEIIEEMIAERTYLFEKDVGVALTNKIPFKCDFRVKNNAIAIEYLTEQDRLALGEIPPPAAGSRLHVLQGQTVPSAPGLPAEPVYILFIDDRNFVYHFNPTSEQRADVTFMEVDSRLRRDLADFLSWYETKVVKR